VFVLEENEYRNLQPLSEKEKFFIRNFYDEKDIGKYLFIKSGRKYLLYLTKQNCPEITKYSQLKEHLSKYKKIMQERRETKKGTISWFQLHWPREEKYFEGEKIVMPAMFNKPTATLISEPAYFGLSTNLMVSLDKNYNLKYILSIINSKFALDWFRKNGKKRGIGIDIGVGKLRLFPIKIATKDEQKLFVVIVDRILAITKTEDYSANPVKQEKVKEYGHQIEQMVYKLYNLTDEEIEIIEDSK
jgi:adenine-specific DNA-methyltransferase